MRLESVKTSLIWLFLCQYSNLSGVFVAYIAIKYIAKVILTDINLDQCDRGLPLPNLRYMVARLMPSARAAWATLPRA